MYDYNVTVTRVIDGDTVDVDIDLGFGVVLKKERVRIMGIDTEESRTRDKVEDLFGCLLYTSPSPRDRQKSRMPSSA